jgi:hypothetical protein
MTVSSLKREQNNMQAELQNLRAKHQLEIEKEDVAHQNEMKNRALNNRAVFNEVKEINNKEIMDEVARKEKILNEVQNQINLTKKVYNQELDQMTNDHVKRKDQNKKVYEGEVQNLKLDQSLNLQVTNDEGNLQIQKLKNEVENAKKDITHESKKEVLTTKMQSSQELEMEKAKFSDERRYNEEKYNKELFNMQKFQKNALEQKHKQYEKTLIEREKNNNQLIAAENEKSNEKLKFMNKTFAERFESQAFKDQKNLQNIEKRKENILAAIKDQFIDSYKTNMELSKDPFYTFGEMDFKLETYPKEKHFLLKVNIPEHALPYIKVNAQEKNITLTLNRNFEHTRNGESGEVSKSAKIESFISKIPTEYVVNPKIIEKNYIDNQCIFKIGMK